MRSRDYRAASLMNVSTNPLTCGRLLCDQRLLIMSDLEDPKTLSPPSMLEFPIRTVDHSATSLQIVEDREVSDSDSSDFENGGYLDCLERDELYLATRLASALFIRDILDEPSVEIGLAIVQNRLTRNHGPMPSYEDMQTPTPENLWGIITAVAADLIFAMEMHPVPPLTDDEEDAWRRVVKRIRDDYIEDPIHHRHQLQRTSSHRHQLQRTSSHRHQLQRTSCHQLQRTTSHQLQRTSHPLQDQQRDHHRRPHRQSQHQLRGGL
ncbi:uncharacterized protein [Hyperolius riggenbachi]|uniref:uncharacterized protein isoform X2 n=2 Tax=Hyperolius riggenbachi TaxID=752182 RepID=UPI0035A39BB9